MKATGHFLDFPFLDQLSIPQKEWILVNFEMDEAWQNRKM